MTLKVFFAVAVLASFAACKTPYKATDKPTPKVDSSSSTVDTKSSSTNTNPLTTDSVKTSAKIDSLRMPVTTDSAKIPSVPDSTKAPVIADSTKISSTTDSTKSTSINKPSAATVIVPAATITAFTAQYPGATNVVWSSYDSLAAVPIDLRMAGWKKMDFGKSGTDQTFCLIMMCRLKEQQEPVVNQCTHNHIIARFLIHIPANGVAFTTPPNFLVQIAIRRLLMKELSLSQ